MNCGANFTVWLRGMGPWKYYRHRAGKFTVSGKKMHLRKSTPNYMILDELGRFAIKHWWWISCFFNCENKVIFDFRNKFIPRYYHKNPNIKNMGGGSNCCSFCHVFYVMCCINILCPHHVTKFVSECCWITLLNLSKLI